MEAVLLLLTQVVPPLIKLGVDVAPYVTAARNTTEALFEGNHITLDQYNELRALNASRESEWAAKLAAAEAEAKG